MGRTHGMSGVLAGIATVPVVGGDPVNQSVWVAVVAGTALLPDLDMPHSTIGRMWGPITRGWGPLPGVASLVKAVAGGHRKGTHCWIGIGITMLAVLMSSWWAASSAVLVAICTGMVILAADFAVIPGKMHWRENLAVSAGVGITCYVHTWTLPAWLAFAVGAGMIVHCLGDEITYQRVPWLYPLGERRPSRDVSWWRIRTGGKAEAVLLVLISTGCVLLLTWRAT